jgi:glycosyltransferase involved in cell wall biosynthesis
MKVLVTGLSRLTSPSGICRYAANLCLSLEPQAEVTLAVGAWQADYYAKNLGIEGTSIKLVSIDIPNRPSARNVWYRRTMPVLAREIGADVVHVSYPVPASRKACPAPIVGTVHDMYPFDFPQNFGFPHYLLNQAAFRAFVKCCSRVTCVSGTTKKRFLELFPKAESSLAPIVVYNTVRQSERLTAVETLVGREFVLCVAQHRKNKMLDQVIRNFPKFDLPADALLVIVGSHGPETEALQAQAAASPIKDRILFLRDLEEPSLAWLYANARLLISASVFEGFCLPLVEAALYGCPVVCTDIDVHKEVAPPGCVFYSLDGGDESQVRAVNELLAAEKPGPDEMARFSPESARASYLSLYRGLVSGT